MLSKDIKKVMKEDEKWTNLFERWDRTGIDPFAEKKVTLSIREENHVRLKDIARKRGKSMSDIVDNLIEKHAN